MRRGTSSSTDFLSKVVLALLPLLVPNFFLFLLEGLLDHFVFVELLDVLPHSSIDNIIGHALSAEEISGTPKHSEHCIEVTFETSVGV